MTFLLVYPDISFSAGVYEKLLLCDTTRCRVLSEIPLYNTLIYQLQYVIAYY